MNTTQEQRQKELLELLQGVERGQENPFGNEDHCAPDMTISNDTIENNEDVLIAQCQQGKRRRTAFNHFIRRYLDMVYSYVFLVIQNQETSVQITRAVFVKAYHRLPSFRSSSIRGWLLALAEKQLFIATGSWYRVFIPFRLYQWVQTHVEPDEPDDETASPLTTKDCEEIDPLLAAYLDAELRPEETERVEQHLAQCDRCALAFEQLAQTIGAVRRVKPVKAPINLAVSINMALDREPFWRSVFGTLGTWGRHFPLALPQSAMTLFVVAGFVMVLNSQHEKYFQLETQLSRVTRSLDQFGAEVQTTPIVILTGSLAEGEDSELVATYVSKLSSTFPHGKPPNMNPINSPMDEVETQLHSIVSRLGGEILDEQRSKKGRLAIKTITVIFPKYTRSLLTNMLNARDLRPPEMKYTPDVPETTLEIYLLGTLR